MNAPRNLKLALTGTALLGTAPLALGQGTIVSGNGNNASGQSSVIVGGNGNTASGLISGIITGAQNTASNQGAGIITGFQNQNAGFDSIIVAGARGKILAGGAGNVILAGIDNTHTATAKLSLIGAGSKNSSAGERSGVVVGESNSILTNAVNSAVLSGRNSTVDGLDSAMLCGANNSVGTNAVFAAVGGQQATVNHSGSFVWNSSTTPFGSTADNQFLINATGNVGIGTNNPTWSLEVAGDSVTTIMSKAHASSWGGTFYGKSANGTAAAPTATTSGNALAAFRGSGHDGGSFRTTKASMQFHASQNWTSTAQGTEIRFSTTDNGTTTLDERMRITNDGRVGIGTTNPTRARVDIGSALSGVTGAGSFFDSNDTPAAGPSTFTSQTLSYSLFASGAIGSGAFVAVQSDERVKRIEGRSDAAADLSTLRSIEITNYGYIDTVTKGNGLQKKLIAQQVETIYPQAVSRGTGVLPDIYKKAPIEGGWVELATDLKVGERVRLITENGVQNQYEVLEVTEDKFRTAANPDAKQIFVYGREVNDLRAVDYDAISMLNVSATQELARKLETRDLELTKMRAELTELRATNEALAKKLDSLDSLTEKLARLENALGSDAEAVAVSVPLQ